MADQSKARAAWSGTGEAADSSLWFDIAEQHGSTDFLGYDTEIAEAQILNLVRDGKNLAQADTGESALVVLNQSPFYAESGGQVGDQGVLSCETGSARITDTKKVAGVFLHYAEITSGHLQPGIGCSVAVDHQRRAIAQTTPTHLLHEALRVGGACCTARSLNAAIGCDLISATLRR